MQKICIIIPCYNEEKRLPVKKYEDFYESNSISLCFVNDGSTDNTLEILKKLQAGKEDRFFIIDFEENLGKAEAIRLASLELSNKKQFDKIGFFDADLSTPLNEIFLLDKYLNSDPEYVLAFGSRILRLGSTIKRNSYRHYSGRIFSTLASLILHLPVYDTQCGAKIIKADLINVIFEEKFLSHWWFDIEIFARLIKFYGHEQVKNKLIEVPLNTWIEMGDSKISFFSMIKIPIDLLRIKMKYKINAKR